MNKYLYSKVKTAPDGCWYKNLRLDDEDKSFLKKLGVYCVPSPDGTYTVGILQLKAMLSM